MKSSKTNDPYQPWNAIQQFSISIWMDPIWWRNFISSTCYHLNHAGFSLSVKENRCIRTMIVISYIGIHFKYDGILKQKLIYNSIGVSMSAIANDIEIYDNISLCMACRRITSKLCSQQGCSTFLNLQCAHCYLCLHIPISFMTWSFCNCICSYRKSA